MIDFKSQFGEPLAACGRMAASHSRLVASLWAVAILLLVCVTPDWSQTTREGELTFLPESAPSRVAERRFREAFPPMPVSTQPLIRRDGGGGEVRRQRLPDPLRENLVIVLRRKDRGREGLQPEDFQFIETSLTPRLLEIAREIPREGSASAESGTLPVPPADRVIVDVWTHTHPIVGPLLESTDGQSVLVVLDLNVEFLDRGSRRAMQRIEALLNEHELKVEKPAGLDIVLSGSAVIADRVRSEELATLFLVRVSAPLAVLALLILLLRTPVMALLGVITVVAGVEVALGLLAWGVAAELASFSLSIGIYTALVGYLIGPLIVYYVLTGYRGSVGHEGSFAESMARTLRDLAGPLTAAGVIALAGTLAFGLSRFGVLKQLGIAFPTVILFELLLVVTCLPACVTAFGRLAFWPDVRHERIAVGSAWLPRIKASEIWRSLPIVQRVRAGWRMLLREMPGAVLTVSVVAILALASLGMGGLSTVHYGILDDLPIHDPGVIGVKAVQEAFPGGMTGPTTLLVWVPEGTLANGPLGHRRLSQELTEALWERAEELDLADVRSQSQPWGMSQQAEQIPAAILGDSIVGLRTFLPLKGRAARSRLINKAAYEAYVSTSDEWKDRLMRLDLVFRSDPYGARSIANLDRIERAVQDALPDHLDGIARVSLLGPTASLRDLGTVVSADRWQVSVLSWLVAGLALTLLADSLVLSFSLSGLLWLSGLAGAGVVTLVHPSTLSVGLDWRMALVPPLVILLGGVVAARVRGGLREAEGSGLRPPQLRRFAMLLLMASVPLWGSELWGMRQLGWGLIGGWSISAILIATAILPSSLAFRERRTRFEVSPPGTSSPSSRGWDRAEPLADAGSTHPEFIGN